MDFIYIASFPVQQNISFISLHLLERGIKHEIVEEGSHQHLFVDPSQAEKVMAFLKRLSGQGDGQSEVAASREGEPGKLKAFPLTTALVLLGLLGYGMFRWDITVPLIQYLSFTQIVFHPMGIEYVPFMETYFEKWQWWRLITPVFIHFSLWHILFNGMAIWELGRRLEIFLGARHYFLLFGLLAIVSNVAQYVMTSASLFGGLSGVLFGYLGLIGVLYRKSRHPLLRLPKGIYILGSVSLLAGIFNVFGFAFDISIANGAHLGGLLAGIIAGLVMPLRHSPNHSIRDSSTGGSSPLDSSIQDASARDSSPEKESPRSNSDP